MKHELTHQVTLAHYNKDGRDKRILGFYVCVFTNQYVYVYTLSTSAFVQANSIYRKNQEFMTTVTYMYNISSLTWVFSMVLNNNTSTRCASAA